MEHLAILLLATATFSSTSGHALPLTQFLTEQQQREDPRMPSAAASPHEPVLYAQAAPDGGISSGSSIYKRSYRRLSDGEEERPPFSAYLPHKYRSFRSQYQSQITPFVLLSLIRLVLYEHDVADPKIDDVISEVVARLGSGPSQPEYKRSHIRSRINVQSRVSPFGTKIAPNRNSDKNSGTLLRYGRSMH